MISWQKKRSGASSLFWCQFTVLVPVYCSGTSFLFWCQFSGEIQWNMDHSDHFLIRVVSSAQNDWGVKPHQI